MKESVLKFIPNCDFKKSGGLQCLHKAKYDFPTKLGSWAYGCETHAQIYGRHGWRNIATQLVRAASVTKYRSHW